MVAPSPLLFFEDYVAVTGIDFAAATPNLSSKLLLCQLGEPALCLARVGRIGMLFDDLTVEFRRVGFVELFLFELGSIVQVLCRVPTA